MRLYKKRPIIIGAVQFDGTLMSVVSDLHHSEYLFNAEARTLTIPTLEGDMTAKPLDWIIRGVNSEIYPCKPDIFEKTYEAV